MLESFRQLEHGAGAGGASVAWSSRRPWPTSLGVASVRVVRRAAIPRATV